MLIRQAYQGGLQSLKADLKGISILRETRSYKFGWMNAVPGNAHAVTEFLEVGLQNANVVCNVDQLRQAPLMNAFRRRSRPIQAIWAWC